MYHLFFNFLSCIYKYVYIFFKLFNFFDIGVEWVALSEIFDLVKEIYFDIHYFLKN